VNFDGWRARTRESRCRPLSETSAFQVYGRGREEGFASKRNCWRSLLPSGKGEAPSDLGRFLLCLGIREAGSGKARGDLEHIRPSLSSGWNFSCRPPASLGAVGEKIKKTRGCVGAEVAQSFFSAVGEQGRCGRHAGRGRR